MIKIWYNFFKLNLYSGKRKGLQSKLYILLGMQNQTGVMVL